MFNIFKRTLLQHICSRLDCLLSLCILFQNDYLGVRLSYHGVCRLIQSVSSLWRHLRMPIKGLSETYGGNHYFRQESPSPNPFSVWRRIYGEAERSRLFLYSIIIIRSAFSVNTVQFFMKSALFASPGQSSSRGLSTVV